MDLSQFRKIYSDFRSSESAAKADQYKAWDYASQHMNMRVPLDKRQYDPRKDEADETFFKVDKFEQRPKPVSVLSKLIPTFTGGINSSLAGKDFRDTSAKFVSYAQLFNHVPMVPDVVNIVKKMLNPLQIQVFLESLNSMESNDKSPGLILSTMLIDFIQKMVSTLLACNDALKNNDRRLYLDSINKIQTLQKDFNYTVLPSKAAELLARLALMVIEMNEAKQDNFDEAETRPDLDIRNNAANAAEDMNMQNVINIENSVKPLGAMANPTREQQPQMESINSTDYLNGGRVLLQLYSDLKDLVTVVEEPLPILRSEARSTTKTSNVRTIMTDTKSRLPPKAPTLKDLLRKLVGKKDNDKSDELDDTPDDAPPAPANTVPAFPQPPIPIPPAGAEGFEDIPSAVIPTTTPQGPTTIAPNNAAMVPNQPTPAQTVPLVDEIGQIIETPTQTIVPATEPPPPARRVPPPPAIVPPPPPAEDLGYLIMLPWKQQMPIIFNLPDNFLDESKLFTQYTYPTANREGIFWVDKGTDRINLIRSLKSISQPFGGKPGVDVNVDLQFTRKGLGSYSPLKPEVENELDRRLTRPRDETGRLVRANGKPRGRGRPKRTRDEGETAIETKKARVQEPSSLSSFALPAQVAESSDIMNLHKDDIVTSITVKRSPIPQFMEDLFESLSNGTWSQLKKKHGFDSFFHLAAVINDTILIEKNSNGINVAEYKPYESEDIQVPSKLLGKFTLGQMVDKVKNDMGSDFSSYHPFENNCQNFMFRFLKVSKALTPQIAEFVSQPIDNLVKDLPAYFPPLVKAAADVYGVVQPMLNPNE